MVIRLFKEVAEFLYLTLLWQRHHGYEAPHVLSTFREDRGKNLCKTEQERMLAHQAYQSLYGRGLQYQPSEAFLEDIGKQLGRSYSGNGDGALLDEMVQLLSMAFPRNRLASGVITQLRRLALSPEEIASVRERLAKVELQCGGCKRLLRSGEMVTLRIPEEGRNTALDGASMLCMRCCHPDSVPANCREDHWREVPQSLLKKLMSEKTCPQCQAEKLAATEQAENTQRIQQEVQGRAEPAVFRIEQMPPPGTQRPRPTIVREAGIGAQMPADLQNRVQERIRQVTQRRRPRLHPPIPPDMDGPMLMEDEDE